VASRILRRTFAASVIALVGSASFALTNPTIAVAADPAVSVAVPAYFVDDALWTKALDTPAVRYVIGHPLAPVAGEAYKADPELADRLAQAKAKGKITLVYVTGGYDKVDWRVVADRIDTVLAAYPAAAGVFIDEINYDQCEKYSSLSKGTAAVKGIRARQPGKLIVLNPGAPMLNCYDGLADGYVNLERADRDIPAWTTNVNLAGNVPYYSWMFSAANRPKMWQAIHSVNPSNASAAVDAALSRNASVLYITDDVMPNPYDTLPTDATWKSVLDRVGQYNSGQIALPPLRGVPIPSAKSADAAPSTTVKPGSKPTTKKAVRKTTKRR
jgi:Spherulation-specific family 4